VQGVQGVFMSAALIANRSKARSSEMKFIRWRMRIHILSLIDVRVSSHKSFISLTCWMLIFIVDKLVFIQSDQTSFLNAMLQPRWIDQRFLILLSEEFCFDVSIFEDDVSGRARLGLFNDVCSILSLQFIPETKRSIRSILTRTIIEKEFAFYSTREQWRESIRRGKSIDKRNLRENSVARSSFFVDVISEINRAVKEAKNVNDEKRERTINLRRLLCRSIEDLVLEDRQHV
jgi:hypothetical protein